MATDFKARISTEKYKNEIIVIFDFAKLTGNDFISMLKISEEYIVTEKDLLIIFDVTSATVFGEVLEEAKKFAKIIKNYRRKSALLGVIGAKKILLQSILFFSGGLHSRAMAFDAKEDALNWLVKPL